MGTIIINIILLIYITLCSFSDIYFRKIFNSVTFAAIFLGFLLNILFSGVSGFGNSIAGLIVGFSIFFLFYLIGGFGAGDVKFMMAVGSLKGASFTIMGGLYGALAAGIFALFVLIWNKRLFSTLTEVFVAVFLFFTHKKPEHLRFDEKKSIYIPYAAFLSLGMLIRLIENSK